MQCFIKLKISQLKSDIQSCRCKNFSLKQASGLIGGESPDPPPGSATANKLLIHKMSIPPGPTNSPIPPSSLVWKIVKRAYTCKMSPGSGLFAFLGFAFAPNFWRRLSQLEYKETFQLKFGSLKVYLKGRRPHFLLTHEAQKCLWLSSPFTCKVLRERSS